MVSALFTRSLAKVRKHTNPSRLLPFRHKNVRNGKMTANKPEIQQKRRHLLRFCESACSTAVMILHLASARERWWSHRFSSLTRIWL